MNYNQRKQIIDEWIKQHESHCAELGTISHCWCIGKFLDMVALKLWTNKFNPNDIDCPYNSYEEAETHAIKSIKEVYSYIINVFPLEVLYFYGYNSAQHECFLIDYIFGKEPEYIFASPVEKYIGEFTPKMEDILINKLGVKKLIK